MKKNLLSLMMLLLAFVGVARAEVVEIGDGGAATNSYLPSYSYYNYSLTQQIYTAEEIGTAGTITSVAFYNGGSDKTRTYEMYLVHTDKYTFDSNTDWITATSADLVFSGEVNMVAGVWTTIELDTPFDYNGSSNLALIMDDNTGSWVSGMACRVFNTDGNQAIRVYSDPTNYDPTNPTSYNGTLHNVKNQIQLDIEPASTCDAPTNLQIIEIGPHHAYLTWTGSTGDFNVDFKKASESTWTNLATNCGWNYVFYNLEANTAYQARVQANCPDGSTSAWRTITFVTRIACPAPTNLQIAEGSLTAHGVTMTWDSEEGEYFQYAMVIGISYDPTTVNWGQEEINNSPTWITLFPDTDYTFFVRRWCDANEQSEAVYFSFRTPISCPAPTDLTATPNPDDNTMVTFSWTENGEATQWQLCFDDDESNLLTTTMNPSTMTGFELNETVAVKVRAYCGEGDVSEWSNTVIFEPTNKLVIGSGNSTYNYLPTNCYYKYALTQQLYTPEEIGMQGLINSIDFYNASSNSQTRNINLYMLNTDKVSFDYSSDWLTVTEADLVFGGEVTFIQGAWTSIELTNAFNYDGTGNLAVIVDDNTGSYTSTTPFSVFSTTSQAIYIYNDPTDYDPYAPSYNGTVLNVKNQIRLDITGTPITFTYHTVNLSVDPEYSGYVQGGGSFLEGRECTIIASPEYGYSFVNWTDANGNVVTTEPTYTFTLTEDIDFVAHFEPRQACEITVMVNPEEAGYSYSGGTYYVGDTIYIEAYSYSSLYNFVNWTNESGNIVSEEMGFSYGITTDATLIANFTPISTDLVVSPEPIDLGPRPNGAWMRPVQLVAVNYGFPTTIQEIETSNDYFVVNQGNLTVPFTLDQYQSVELTVSSNPESTLTGAVNADFIITYLQGENTATFAVPMTATAYTPVAGDVWENPIVVNQFPYTAPVDAANAPYYNNYVMPFPNVPDGYDVVYKLTFEQDTYLNAGIIADATGIVGENAKVALYPEDFKGLGGPDENNYYTNPMSAAVGAPFEAQIGEGTNTSGYFPFYTLYNYSIAENLFLAYELEEAGVTTAPMTSLSWYATNAPGYPQQGISIWMANVGDTELTGVSHTVNDMTLVYTGAVTPEIGWNEFLFNEGTFSWDGQSNVLILCQRNNGSWNSTVYWQTHNPGFNAMSYRYQDDYAYDVNVSNSMYTSTNRANIIMKSELGRAEVGGNRDNMELTVYDGTTTSNYVPAYIFYFDDFAKSQYVIPAGDLAEMNGGSISSLKFYTTSSNVPYTTVSDVDVYLMEVDYTSISAYEPKENGTIVYQGLLDVVSAGEGGEITIDFSTPYTYNGGNLLIGIENTTDMGYKNIYFYGQTVTGASIAGSNGSSPDSAPANQRNFIPKTTFTYTAGGAVGPQITDMTVVPGTYYLVASSTSESFTVNIETSTVPCPEVPTIVYPADQAFVENYVTSVPLRWKLDDRATEYCLRFGTDPANLETIVNWTDTLAESYTVRNLNYHTAYYWQVCERNDGCPNGVEGPVCRFTTTINGPTDLYSLNGYEIMVGDTLRLSWTAPAETSRSFMHYTVDGWYWDADSQSVEVVNANTNNTYYEVEGLEYNNETPYHFTVWAVYDIGLSLPYAARTNIIDIYVMAESEVQGHVYEQDGSTGIANATVTLYGYDDFGYYHDYTFTTDENGAYSGAMVLGDCFSAYATAGGYQEVWYEDCVAVGLDSITSGINFIMDEVFTPTFDVEAEYYPDPNAYDGNAVKVSWSDENWHTYCEYEFNNAWQHNSGTTTWGYYYPAEVLAPYMGYSLDKVSVFSDNMYNAVGGNYTCNIYEGGETPYEGTLVSTITVDVPQGMNAWMKYALTTPVEITGNTGGLWVIWTANTSLGGYPAGCCDGNNENGDWWYNYYEENWMHQSGYCWTMRNHFSDGTGRSVVLGNNSVMPAKFNSNNTVDKAPIRIANNGESASCVNANAPRIPLRQPEQDRSLQYYRVYRTDYFNYDELTDENAVLVADNVTENSIIDQTFAYLPMGTYKYGVSCVYEGNRESRITWIQERFGNDEAEAQKILSKLNRDESVLLIDESFEEGIPEGWNIIDADGDGRKWKLASELMGSYYTAHTGDDMMTSESYGTNVGPLYPDNYLVTPQVALGGTFSFWACAQDSEYAAEHFGVAVSTYNNSSTYYFNTIQEWTLTSRGQGANNAITRSNSRSMGNWQQYTVDLSEYTGQYGYIAIRHFGCSGMFYLDVDDIQLTEPNIPHPLQGPRESEIVWSNPVDRDMYLYNNVDITVTLNSGDSPEGVYVELSQNWEQSQLNPLNNTLSFYMDETGYHAWDVFRKGEYYVYIWKEGYQEVYSEWMYIDDETHLVFELEEIMEGVSDLYVSRTGWASWKGLGNDAPALTNHHYGSVFFDFEDGLEGWTNIDADGDGLNWVHSSNSLSASGYDYTGKGHDGTNGFAYSQSYIDYQGAYSANNYLVTNQKYAITANSRLTFFADYANDSYPDYFEVCIATTDEPTVNDFTTVWGGNAKVAMNEKASIRHKEGSRYDNWREHTVDLSAYAGQDVWIAFHHLDYDMYEIWIDDVELTGGDAATRHYEEIQVTLTTTSGDTLFVGTTDNDYMQLPTEGLVEDELYCLNVVQNYSSGQSSQVATCYWVYQPCENFEGAVDLTGFTDTTGIVLSWSYPDPEGTRPMPNESEVFFEDFDNGMPADWTTIDADYDGYSWVSSMTPGIYHNNGVDLTGTGHNGSAHYVISCSWANGIGQVLYPDNYLVSPEIVLGGSISFWACAQDASYAADHFGVAVSTASNTNPDDFTTIQEWTMTAKGVSNVVSVGRHGNNRAQGNWYEYTVDLSAYAGQMGYVALRHFNCADQFILNVDDITIVNGDAEPGPVGNPFAAAIFRNGEWIEFTRDAMFIDAEGSEEDTYEVRIVYDGTKRCPYNNAYFSMSCPQQVLFAHEITAMAQPEEGGTVEGAGIYNHGDICTLTATANEGYGFVNWTNAAGEEVSTNAAYTFTVTETATFVANFVSTTPTDVTQTNTLYNGWNWWSTYIEADNLLEQLENSLGSNGMTIKSQNGFVQYLPEYQIWYGSLNFEISNEFCYMIQTNATCEVAINGVSADPANHPITLSNGWNWIGYPNATHLSFTEAFSNINPSDEDQVKSQSYGFASYLADYNIWYGTLSDHGIDPGMGMLYKSNNNQQFSFTYPNGRNNVESSDYTAENNHWTTDFHAYPENMTITAVVELDDVELASDRYELAAFANGECRGSVRLLYVEPLHRYMAFLTVVGDEATELSFGLYDSETGLECFNSEDGLVYTTNAVVGSMTEPLVIHFRDLTGTADLESNLHVFPNPVNHGERFSIGLPEGNVVRVEIVNALGSVISTETSTKAPASILAPNVAGVYTLRVIVEGKGVYCRKLVVR